MDLGAPLHVDLRDLRDLSSLPMGLTRVSCIARGILNHWTICPREQFYLEVALCQSKKLYALSPLPYQSLIL